MAATRAVGARTTGRDRGDTMLMTTILVTFLMLGSFALVAGSQQWSARRDVQAAATAAARAGVQVSAGEVRGGRVVIDPAAAEARARQVTGASGYLSTIRVSGISVTVTVTGPVDYSFEAPGFASTMTATATATVQRGVAAGG